MKKILPGIGFLLMSIAGFSQDLIIRNDGRELSGKVLDITSSHVKYKDRTADTICKANRSDVFMICYENGQEVLLNDPADDIAQKEREETGDLDDLSTDLFGTTLQAVDRSTSVLATMRKAGAGGVYPLFLLGRAHQIIGSVVFASGAAIALGASVLYAIDEDYGVITLLGYGAALGVGLIGAGIHAIGEWMVDTSYTIYKSKRSEYLEYKNLTATTLHCGLATHGIGFTLQF